MPETLLRGIHHVALICSDYERSKAFYNQVLGLRVVREVYRQARDSWKCDLEVSPGVQLELFSFHGAPSRPSWPEARGLRHLAFAVADVDAAITALATHGVVCEAVRVDEHTGCRFVFFADPDGLPIELYETSLARDP